MKVKKVLINFLIFGSILTAAVIFAELISLLINGKNITSESIFRLEYLIVFFLGGTMFTVMRCLFEHIIKNYPKRVMFFKSQIIIYAILLVISVISLILSICYSIEILKLFSIMLIVVIIIYELGLNIAFKSLKKDIEKINQKLKENN